MYKGTVLDALGMLCHLVRAFQVPITPIIALGEVAYGLREPRIVTYLILKITLIFSVFTMKTSKLLQVRNQKRECTPSY